jgi:hypothetical protein
MKIHVCALITITLISLASIAQASDLQGTFSLLPRKSDNVGQAVESTVSNMNFIIRPIARKMITEAAVPNQNISITSSGNKLSILADGCQLPTSTMDGTRTKYLNPDGVMIDMRMRLEGNRLEQIFATKNGSMTNLCELSQDGQELAVNVVIRSAYFEKPLTYKLVYQKSP